MTKQNSTEALAPWEETTDASAAVATQPEGSVGLSEFDDFSEPDPYDGPIPPEKEPLIDEIASEYVGFWNLLVSKTNWEKGKVIHSWREKLREAKLPRRVYSDDAIATRIGNVSPQHVGRLRRVYERFGSEPTLPGLYWSHYQAALDWEDADEWLKKASDEKLSVAQTRVARWEKMGAKLQSKPREEDIVSAEPDEDVNPFNDSNADGFVAVNETQTTLEDAEKEKSKKPKKQKKNENPLGEYAGEVEPWESSENDFTTTEVLDAISKLEPLPSELADAFESFKCAILSQKVMEWHDVTPLLVAQYLSELKRLLVAKEKVD